MLHAAIDHDIARGYEGPVLFEATGRILVRIPRALVRLCAVLLVAFASFGQSVQKHAQLYEMSASFHFQGFPEDVPLSPKPNYPSDLTDLTLEYFASGCYGPSCFHPYDPQRGSVLRRTRLRACQRKENRENKPPPVLDIPSRLV